MTAETETKIEKIMVWKKLKNGLKYEINRRGEVRHAVSHNIVELTKVAGCDCICLLNSEYKKRYFDLEALLQENFPEEQFESRYMTRDYTLMNVTFEQPAAGIQCLVRCKCENDYYHDVAYYNVIDHQWLNLENTVVKNITHWAYL